MTGQDKLKKTLELLMMLDSPFGVAPEAITNRFKMSERTLYRYIDTFRATGFIIEKEKGMYRIVKNESVNKNIGDLLHFSEEESFMLSNAIHNIEGDTPTKQKLLRKLYSVYNHDRIARAVLTKDETKNVSALMVAIKNSRQVLIREYRSSNSQSIRDRHVEPFGFTNNYDSVWALDLVDKKNKTFKTSRMGSVEVLNNYWAFADLHKVAFTDVFRTSGLKKTPIKLRLTMRAANLMMEEYPLTNKYLKRLGDGTYFFDGWVASVRGAARFVLGLADQVTVIEPVELKYYIKKKIYEFLKNN